MGTRTCDKVGGDARLKHRVHLRLVVRVAPTATRQTAPKRVQPRQAVNLRTPGVQHIILARVSEARNNDNDNDNDSHSRSGLHLHQKEGGSLTNATNSKGLPMQSLKPTGLPPLSSRS